MPTASGLPPYVFDCAWAVASPMSTASGRLSPIRVARLRGLLLEHAWLLNPVDWRAGACELPCPLHDLHDQLKCIRLISCTMHVGPERPHPGDTWQRVARIWAILAPTRPHPDDQRYVDCTRAMSSTMSTASGRFLHLLLHIRVVFETMSNASGRVTVSTTPGWFPAQRRPHGDSPAFPTAYRGFPSQCRPHLSDPQTSRPPASGRDVQHNVDHSMAIPHLRQHNWAISCTVSRIRAISGSFRLYLGDLHHNVGHPSAAFPTLSRPQN